MDARDDKDKENLNEVPRQGQRGRGRQRVRLFSSIPTDWRMEFDEGIRLLVMERRCKVTIERCDETPDLPVVSGIK